MTEGNMPSRMSWYSLIMPLRLDPRLHNDVDDDEIEGIKMLLSIVLFCHVFRCNCLLHFSLHVIAGGNADTPFPAVPSGPSHRQLLRDLQQQLLKFFTSKPNEKVSFLMGKIIF
jgi:hypothetical protein